MQSDPVHARAGRRVPRATHRRLRRLRGGARRDGAGLLVGDRTARVSWSEAVRAAEAEAPRSLSEGSPGWLTMAALGQPDPRGVRTAATHSARGRDPRPRFEGR